MAIALGITGCSHRLAEPKSSPAMVPQKVEDPKSRYEAGKADAARDIKNGRLVMLGWQRNQNADAYAQLLKTKYGVEVSMQTGPVTEATQAYALGYNEVMSVELKRKLGDDVLDRMAEDAMKIGNEKTQ